MTPQFLKVGTRFAKFPHALVVALLVAVGASPHAISAVVTANGFQLKLNGQPFVVKGMNYSPVPIGTFPGYIPYCDYFIP